MTAVIAYAGWLELQGSESTIVHNCPSLKGHYMLRIWGRWSYVIVGRDLGRLMFEASDLGLETFERREVSGR